MKAVLDTRFFIASLESKDEQFKKWARLTLDALEKTANLGLVPSIVILELYKIQLERFGKDVAETRLNSVLKSKLHIINLDSVIAIQAAKLRCKYPQLPTADAVIAATAIKTGSDCVLTDDNHIKQIKETKTRWL
ncbi:MAG: PIN domain-containing protein [Candidatus Bathyarchaeota archaeon]|nr:PIN domain-containing protein [Candidatus Bathyarchaeota archaeon]